MPYLARHHAFRLQSSATSHSRSWFEHLPFLSYVGQQSGGHRPALMPLPLG